MRRSPTPRARPLTTRECETLQGLEGDMGRKQIAAKLGISPSTVGNLAANAYRKLEVHTAAAAVRAHGIAHFWCGSRDDFAPVLKRLRATRKR